MDQPITQDQNAAQGSRVCSSLNKQDLLDILQHDSFIQTLERFIKHRGFVQFWKTLSFLLMALLGIGGFYLAWVSNLEAKKASENRAFYQLQATHIERVIANKLHWMRQQSIAIGEMRRTRANIILQCKYQKPPSAYDQQFARTKVRFDLIELRAGIRFIFDQKVEDTLNALIEFDRSIADVCAPNAPPDSEWHKFGHQADELMATSIRNDAKLLEKIRFNIY